jgi:hypothetical protein
MDLTPYTSSQLRRVEEDMRDAPHISLFLKNYWMPFMESTSVQFTDKIWIYKKLDEHFRDIDEQSSKAIVITVIRQTFTELSRQTKVWSARSSKMYTSVDTMIAKMFNTFDSYDSVNSLLEKNKLLESQKEELIAKLSSQKIRDEKIQQMAESLKKMKSGEKYQELINRNNVLEEGKKAMKEDLHKYREEMKNLREQLEAAQSLARQLEFKEAVAMSKITDLNKQNSELFDKYSISDSDRRLAFDEARKKTKLYNEAVGKTTKLEKEVALLKGLIDREGKFHAGLIEEHGMRIDTGDEVDMQKKDDLLYFSSRFEKILHSFACSLPNVDKLRNNYIRVFTDTLTPYIRQVMDEVSLYTFDSLKSYNALSKAVKQMISSSISKACDGPEYKKKRVIFETIEGHIGNELHKEIRAMEELEKKEKQDAKTSKTSKKEDHPQVVEKGKKKKGVGESRVTVKDAD